ncbi:BRO family protein [Spirillospora sp. NBC_01491]|uniref:BRO family protein n=1 Tax=Spirillospora sp. NBC_01491 TaxID=2976007 RepID=UPI002E2F2540|nr:BRO family protein [Spirillospora sp. NBC_01491]
MSPTPKRQNEVRCPHCGTLNDASRTQCISCKSPMGLAVQPFEFPATGQAVRTVLRDDGEPWFVAADVCAVLAIRNNRDALTALDDDEKGVATTDTPGGEQQVSVVNEPGLYSLILRSRKPEAKAFKRWITHDVLPALRKGGTYSVESRELTRRDLARMVIEEADRADQAEQRAAELAPAAAAWDNLGQAAGDYSVREAAQILDRDPTISTGQNRLFSTLRELRWVDGGGQPYQSHVDAGRIGCRPTSYTHPHSGEPVLSSQIRITVKGLKVLRRHLGGGGQLSVIEGGAA